MYCKCLSILFGPYLSTYMQEKEHILSKLGGELLKSSFDKVSM